MNQRQAQIIVALASMTAFADAVLKFWALRHFPVEHPGMSLLIDFAVHRNPGIAFDIPIPFPIIALLTAGIGFWLIRLAKRSYGSHPEHWASAIVILLGAIGNFVDRAINGFTTDYIILFTRSAINLSDLLIVLGTMSLLWYSERTQREE